MNPRLLEALGKLKKEQNHIEEELKKLPNDDYVAEKLKELNEELLSKINAIQVLNGKDGKNGKDGLPGKDGKDGKNGLPGKDGESPNLKIGKVETSPEYGGASAKIRKNGNTDYLDLVLPRGPQGFTGFDGKDGKGVAKGGSTGQILSKRSDKDFDTEWINSSNYDEEIKNLQETKQDMLQFTVMPSASVELEGKIVQYIGTTNDKYTNGMFYKCINALLEYQWKLVSVSSDNTKLDRPDTTSLSGALVTCNILGQTGTRAIAGTISSTSTTEIPTAQAVYTLFNSIVNGNEVKY